MKRSAFLAAALTAVLALTFGSTACQQLKARDRLNRGVAAFKAARFAEAVDHFKVATDLDPQFSTARLYLATAYFSQFIPGAESPENMEMAKSAYDEFSKVLDQDPNSTLAIASIAALYFHQKKWEDAEKWYARLINTDPKNREGLYTLGVIAWTKSFQKRMEARAKLNMRPEDPGPLKDKKVREQLNTELMAMINTGLGNLQKAIQIDPEYDDAMVYLNLLNRERADLEDSQEAYKKDLDAAEAWVQKSMEIKKIKQDRAARAHTGGIVQETKEAK